MSGRRRRRGRATHVGNPATAEGRNHQGGDGGSSGEPIAADDPMVGASEGTGGGGGRGDVRTSAAATPEDGGLHLRAEGGEGESNAILTGAAANVIHGQPRAAAQTAEVMQCTVGADGSRRVGVAGSNGDPPLVDRKGICFLDEEAATKFSPLLPDVDDRANGDGVCYLESTDGHLCTVAMAKECQVSADGGEWDGACGQALVSPKGSSFLNEQAGIKLPPLQDHVNDGEGGSYSGANDGQTCTLEKENEGQEASDDGGDQVMNSWKDRCFLLDAVMNWRVEDVMNVDLFKKRVKKLPATFSSLQHYMDLHTNLLLEETRASMNLGLLDLAKGQTYDVLSISQTATQYVYFIDIDLNKSSDCSHIVKDGDFFFLTTQPKGESDHSGCFAVATEVGCYPCFQKSFRVLVSQYHKDCNFQEIKHATFLTNIMGGIHLAKTMISVEHGGSTTVESVLWTNEKARREVCSCGELPLDDLSPPNKFNDEQINALKCILSKMRCRHINAPEILWGPPGSGKTEVAAAILHLLFHWQYRVLVCVPSEKVISRFINKFKELFPSFNLSQMTLLNDMDVVEKCDTFDKMSLENRAQELYCCTYTWRSWMKELYFVLEMKPYCQGSCYHEGRICKKNNQIIFSLESFRKKICALIFDLSECSEDLISSLSGKCIYDDDVANLNKLMTELSQFKDLMLSDIITTSDMKWAFQFASSLHLVSEVANRDIAESINAKRMSCLNLMEILIDSFELPLLEDRKNLEDFCIGHSRVIICTPSSISRLLKLKLTSFDTLLVDDASQIKEIDLLIPLAMTRKHVILVGDHLHLQPMVKSEVCKKADYGSSLFERLLHLSSKKMMLTKQYMMHPSISVFVRAHFYGGEGEDALNVHCHDYKKLVDGKLPPYCFFDIMEVDELRVKGKSFVECAVIISLLQSLCKGLKTETGKLSVAVLCLCSSRVDAIKNRLVTKYSRHDRINLEVNTLNDANEDWYDIVILSSVFDAKSELPQGNRINTALTKSRHCLWIICEGNNLLESGGTWEIIVNNAKKRGIFGRLTSSRLSNVMKMLEANDLKRLTATNSAFTGIIMQKPAQEWTWNGRPNNTKNILGSLRDQKNARDTCTLQATLATTESLNKFQCSCLDPPQDFPWELCFNDLKSKYEKVVNEEIASEEIGKKRGKYRQETAFEISKTQGIIGRDKSEAEEQERLFKLESYERVDATLKAEEAEALVEAGSIMACNFRLSRNYFRLKPGEVYVYDRRFPYIHPISDLPVSHAVTVIGHGGQPRPPPAEGQVRHVHVQNSEGKRSGDDGFLRVARDSVRGLYRLTLPPPAAPSSPPPAAPAHD